MLAGCDSMLHLIDVADGKEVGTVEIDGPTGSTPAMRDGRVYFGTERRHVFRDRRARERRQEADGRVDVPRPAARPADSRGRGGRQAGRHLWLARQGDLRPRSGERRRKWKLPTRSRVESSPVIAGNRVVAATTAGKIYLLDTATGEVKWEYDAGGSFIASPAVVDGKIILGNGDGTLYCFGAKHEAQEINHREHREHREEIDKMKSLLNRSSLCSLCPLWLM